MAGMEKMTVSGLNKITRPGRYGDGKGLYLQVTKRNLTKSWVFRYQREGQEHYIGLGPLYAIPLEDAREEARKIRALLARGIDPLQARNAEIARRKALEASQKTFDECVIEYITNHQEAWKSQKHKTQYESSLRNYASPIFGNLAVCQIDTALVLTALRPIWTAKTVTASRVRERIERVLSYAITSGYRQGENPARWHGHLEELLPKPSKIKKTRHHPALPYHEIGEFFGLLQSKPGRAARALELTILTACRSGEVLKAQWDEIDLERRIWIIPGARMKSGVEHRIPLNDKTLAILRPLWGLHPAWVFPDADKSKALADTAMLTVLHKINRHVTVHGFRSTFRTWAAEMTAWPGEIAEISLAHAVGTAVQKAYLRSDLFERRRALMQEWAVWCTASREDKIPS